MKTFTDAELNLIRRLTLQPPQTVLQFRPACPVHSVCSPLPLFQVYKIDGDAFEAQWNEYHQRGTTQIFRFDEAT